ncbi:MAG: ATP-dependent helicase [Acidobacteria bacterium]|nr:ATP-dependent helicase [Acidobacteriota bacterium]
MKKYALKTTSAIHRAIDYQRYLNEEQWAVVSAGSGPLLVIAGAGSGKTRTLTYRVARLMELGVPPERILLLTFTNRAAREMIHRVELLVKQDVQKIWGGTFHHVANLILRRHAQRLGYDNNYTILDREDSKDLLESCVEEVGIDLRERRFPKGDVLATVLSLSANTLRPVSEIVSARFSYLEELLSQIERVAERYREKKQRSNLMDYDDLLGNVKRLLADSEEVRQSYSRRFQHVLVDEYQDTNKIQADLVDLIGEHHRNVMVVGDDSQSIYSFRGANFANIMEFPQRYPDARLFRLETNYRSTPEILHLANLSIAHNQRQYPKVLRAHRRSTMSSASGEEVFGRKPAVIGLDDVLEQASFVAQRILEVRDEGIPLDEIAVLYRSHYHSMELQMELTRRGIPFTISSGLRFFEQRHVKDVIALMKVVVNPRDEIGWKRAVKLLPRIGSVTANRLWKAVSASPDPVRDLVQHAFDALVPRQASGPWQDFVTLIDLMKEPELLREPQEMIRLILKFGYQQYLQTRFDNYEARLEDLTQLGNYAARFESTESFLSDLALLGTVEAEDVIMGPEDDERVRLTTVHQAKGLEWGAVFLIWLADGRFPAARALRDPEGEEEERRLFYVAVTRAKDQLYLCYPLLVRDNRYHATLNKPSRFLQEIDESSYERWLVEAALPEGSGACEAD